MFYTFVKSKNFLRTSDPALAHIAHIPLIEVPRRDIYDKDRLWQPIRKAQSEARLSNNPKITASWLPNQKTACPDRRRRQTYAMISATAL
jgi:hypothetical protein